MVCGPKSQLAPNKTSEVKGSKSGEHVFKLKFTAERNLNKEILLILMVLYFYIHVFFSLDCPKSIIILRMLFI